MGIQANKKYSPPAISIKKTKSNSSKAMSFEKGFKSAKKRK